jgi:hypothetical protein
MMMDKEIGEIRRIRHEISAECGHDVHKVISYYKKVEDELRASGKYRFEEAARETPEGLRRSR